MELRKITISIGIHGNILKANVIEFKIQDHKTLKELYEAWNKLRRGMESFHSRIPNFPEGL